MYRPTPHRRPYSCGGRVRYLVFGLTIAILTIATAVPSYAQAAKRTPVVFVPGFMGSRLVDKQGELWGSLSATWRRVEDLRYKGEDSQVQATEVLPNLVLLGPFKAAGYKPIIDLFEELGYRKNRDLFLFAYDWRKSNLDNARNLSAFIETTPVLRGRRFDLVAHSMGGVLASYFILHNKGAAKVRYFVTLGTAHLGAADVLGNMLGHFTLDVTLLRKLIGKDAFLKLFLSFPSLYEQLPYDSRSCLRPSDGANRAPICDVLDLAFWSNADLSNRVKRYLPKDLGQYLANARVLRRTACADMPSDVRMFRFAGTRLETIGQIKLAFDPLYSMTPTYVPGDGVVPERSASCGDLAGTEVFFTDHHGIIEHEVVAYRLGNILSNREPGRRRGIGREPAKTVLPMASLALKSRYVGPGDRFSAELLLQQPNGKPLAGEIVGATLQSEDGSSPAREIMVTETKPGRYRIAGPADTTSGIYRLAVNVPGAGTLREHFAVLNNEAEAVPLRVLVSTPRGRTPVYRLGDSLDLIVRANRNAWLYCFHRQSSGGYLRIFPNESHRNAFVPGNQVHAIPGNKYPFALDFVAPPGAERTRCFATNRDVTEELPAELRSQDGRLPDAVGKRLPGIFKALPNTELSESALKFDVRP